MSEFVYADLVGKPFQWGARGPESFDCYGLVMEALRRMGRRCPDIASPEERELVAGLALENQPYWTSVAERPGAVALIEVKRRIDGRIRTDLSHVGVVLPFGQLLHAWHETGGVTVEDIELWRRRIHGFYEFPQ